MVKSSKESAWFSPPRPFIDSNFLNPVVEAELVEDIFMLEERRFGITPTDVREITFDHAES